MAFEMYAGEHHQHLDQGEEILLEIASQNCEQYPELDGLRSAFFDDPVLDHERAGRIVHELVELLDKHGRNDKRLERIITKLLPFFSRAFRNSEPIRCSSD